jgi:DNA-binding MurR/RpiR family transcriptional regulator
LILEKIRRTYPQLSKSQRRLADLIVNAYQEAAFMTASRMAKRAGVNEATVIRFAQRLGYPGFPELVRDIQVVVQEELKAPAGGEEMPLLKNLGEELESLERLASHVSREKGEQVVALLRGKHRLWVAGQGVSYWLAGAFVAGLAGSGHEVRLVPGDVQSLAHALAEMEEGDVLVGVAATGESPEVGRAMALARERGVPALAVTWSPLSAMAQMADVALSCPGAELAPACGVGAVAALLDALARTLAGANRAGAQAYAGAVDDALRRLRVG